MEAEVSVSWFVLQAVAALFTLWLGGRIGLHRIGRVWIWLCVGVALIFIWGWLKHHPSVAVHALPLKTLYFIEGTGAVPIFMFVIGIIYGRSSTSRQRRVAVLAMIFGVVYFLQGGMWMLQTTPSASFADTVRGDVVRQSQDFSCVPASCATALRFVGIAATESEMADLTRTRPGTGATLIRAMESLRRKLAHSDVRVSLLEPTYDQLCGLPMPALTPLNLEIGRHHMVVLTEVTEHGARVLDPQLGKLYMDRGELEDAFTHQVIVLER